jgi:hypothetical protein
MPAVVKLCIGTWPGTEFAFTQDYSKPLLWLQPLLPASALACIKTLLSQLHNHSGRRIFAGPFQGFRNLVLESIATAYRSQHTRL